MKIDKNNKKSQNKHIIQAERREETHSAKLRSNRGKDKFPARLAYRRRLYAHDLGRERWKIDMGGKGAGMQLSVLWGWQFFSGCGKFFALYRQERCGILASVKAIGMKPAAGGRRNADRQSALQSLCRQRGDT